MGDYTIQISTKLIDQLARDDEKVKRKSRKPRPKKKTTVQQHEEPQDNALKEFPSEPKTISPAPAPAPVPAPGWPVQPPPMFLPVTPAPPPPPAAMPEVEAIRSILKESEAVLEKLEKQEAGASQELSKRAKELHDKEFKLPYQNPMPCTEERAGCLECYKSNAKDPLKCAEAVRRFEACALMAMKSATAKAD
ncbi:HMG box-containing protein 4 [Panicum miliaceum]|uniref:HMG box-containing protein 4 n=1 Tax=Panicum miliaceum TaxID=4540 RepID=A0A3L6RCS3_PANMI|nr:HMG box-containing protein 4 [Panicum miliaceum]